MAGRHADIAVLELLVTAVAVGVNPADYFPDPAASERDKRPQEIADEYMREAEAKRQRKRAKRATPQPGSE